MKNILSSILHRLGDLFFYRFFYWLRTHTVDRYHIIDMRDPHNGYSWGWQDSDNKMLFANFKILVDFVEKEEAFESHVDWDWEENHKAVKTELLDLYSWWKTGRAKEYEALHNMRVPDLTFGPSDTSKCSRLLPLEGQDRVDMDAFGAEVDRLEKEEDEKLARLIALRHWMWI